MHLGKLGKIKNRNVSFFPHPVFSNFQKQWDTMKKIKEEEPTQLSTTPSHNATPKPALSLQRMDWLWQINECYVEFTKHIKYFRYYITYHLRDKFDINTITYPVLTSPWGHFITGGRIPMYTSTTSIVFITIPLTFFFRDVKLKQKSCLAKMYPKNVSYQYTASVFDKRKNMNTFKRLVATSLKWQRWLPSVKWITWRKLSEPKIVTLEKCYLLLASWVNSEQNQVVH